MTVVCASPLPVPLGILVQINRQRQDCLHTQRRQHYKARLSAVPEVKLKYVDLKCFVFFIWALLFLIMKVFIKKKNDHTNKKNALQADKQFLLSLFQ